LFARRSKSRRKSDPSDRLSITDHQDGCEVSSSGSALDACSSWASSNRLGDAYEMGARLVLTVSIVAEIAGKIAVDLITEVGSLEMGIKIFIYISARPDLQEY